MRGPIELRLVLEGGLVCEVLDNSAALPRLRYPGNEDERGRGLQVVSQMAQRWGARRTAAGKIVWSEQALPRAGLKPRGLRPRQAGSSPAETSPG